MIDTDKIYSKYGLSPKQIVIPAWGARGSVTAEGLIELLTRYDKDTYQILGRSPQTLRKYIKLMFPDLALRTLANRSWESWFLSFGNTKRCSKCGELRDRTLFSKDKVTPDGLKHECKLCIHTRTSTSEYKSKWSEYNRLRYQENLEYNRQWRRDYYQRNKDKYLAASAKRRAVQLQAIPGWADLREIENFYLSRPEGYQIDHIIPLQGDTVCGLHVENNLQYLTETDNKSKGNKLLPEYTC